MLEIKAPLCGPNTGSLRAPEVRQRAKKKIALISRIWFIVGGQKDEFPL